MGENAKPVWQRLRPELRDALDELRSTLAENREEDFDASAERFLRVWRASVVNTDVAGWDELAQLAAFEVTLAGDPSLDPEYFAAVKAVRERLLRLEQEQGSDEVEVKGLLARLRTRE